ncbi:MAG: divalent-cation tolerance protein CutA [Planctomycetota bacterium]|nr:divalent-cation tolerance protein CutA [Planctomycetota bacterium]
MAKKKAKTLPAVRVILVTAPPKEAERIARQLVAERLAACANLVPGLTSLYWWEGKLNRDAETLVILKTLPRHVPRLLKRLKALHSYQVPEFLALPVVAANADYARWVADVCS